MASKILPSGMVTAQARFSHENKAYPFKAVRYGSGRSRRGGASTFWKDQVFDGKSGGGSGNYRLTTPKIDPSDPFGDKPKPLRSITEFYTNGKGDSIPAMGPPKTSTDNVSLQGGTGFEDANFKYTNNHPMSVRGPAPLGVNPGDYNQGIKNVDPAAWKAQLFQKNQEDASKTTQLAKRRINYGIPTRHAPRAHPIAAPISRLTSVSKNRRSKKHKK